ncbi:glycosyltransferase family 9 protein [Pusillimonas sp. SM2304]|uniref:glycosyltransferase family 9 protein n=1 Tax=Pusillimonas sp. SM2304 TaxID=3073241 RepID=UPI002875B863|nr:glycosyltransferase family 9 protein [Pusillimonas sp. SM2304]MDS1142067.1 glycosyltransferase family 9 protein [Pusillimonas sp. SM2304]
MSTISAIYVRLPNWIGDVCMSLPSLHTLLDTRVPIVVCARPWARDLLAAYKLGGFLDMKGRWREDRATVHAFRKKAQHSHPRGILLPDSLSSAMVFKFGGIPSAGYRDDGRSLILRWPVNKPSASLHAVESWHYITTQALKRWNYPTAELGDERILDLQLADRHHAEGRQALADAGLLPGQFVLIAPTATGLHRGKVKVWPHYDALTRRLQAQGHRVAMCPPPSEADAARKNAPTAICLPPLKLGAFATLTQLASLVICNDSGVSHLAAAAGARQLTLFGVTQPERTGPWSDKAICLGSAQAWPTLDQTVQRVNALLT